MVHQLLGYFSSVPSVPAVHLRFLGHEISLVSAVLAVFVASRAFKLVRGLNAVNYLSGLRVPFQPLGFPGTLIPTSWWNPGYKFPWLWRSFLYKDYQSENVSIVPFILGGPSIYSCNLDIARQVAIGGHKTSFYKPKSASQALLIWGMNLVASDGEVWRKHRRIVGTAFNTKLYQSVWKETLQTYREMIVGEGWDSEKVVEVPAVQNITFKLALLIIGKCGFGFSFTWSAPPRALDGTMTVQEALRVVTNSYILPAVLPKWMLSLPISRFRKFYEAYTKLMDFMHASIARRKAELSGGRSAEEEASDAFTFLVKANEDDAGKYKLDDEELIGNIFVMLFAGHETTAHALAATLGFLALHQDIQNEVLEQIISVVGYDQDPTFDQYSRLNKVLAVFYESLRMFPAGHVMIREATEDTILNIPNPAGQEGITPFPVPKGVQVVIDMVGVQYNPRYFDEPEKFKPSRWYDIPLDSEVFSAFSIGPRACLGRKFATTEAVAALTILLRDWTVEPKLNKGETSGQWRDRVMDAHLGITLGVLDVPLRFTRREWK